MENIEHRKLQKGEIEKATTCERMKRFSLPAEILKVKRKTMPALNLN